MTSVSSNSHRDVVFSSRKTASHCCRLLLQVIPPTRTAACYHHRRRYDHAIIIIKHNVNDTSIYIVTHFLSKIILLFLSKKVVPALGVFLSLETSLRFGTSNYLIPVHSSMQLWYVHASAMKNPETISMPRVILCFHNVC